MRTITKCCLMAALMCISATGEVSAKLLSEADKKSAAKLFVDRCGLCHGRVAMGEGMLPMRMGKYPNTNLFKPRQFHTEDELIHVITNGNASDDLTTYMPPWKGELSTEQIKLLARFVIFFRDNLKAATNFLAEAGSNRKVDKSTAAAIFQNRCVLCHGKKGAGDGRMAKIIKDPSPANFQESKMNKAYLSLIITKGGGAIGKSASMPPWGDQLSKEEIKALTDYVYDLRNK